MYPFCTQRSLSIIFKTVTSFNWVFQKLNSIICLISALFQTCYLYKLSFLLSFISQKTQLPLNPSNITYLAADPLPLKVINLSLLILSITLALSVPRCLHNTFGLKKFSLLNGHKKISRNFYLSGDSFVQSLDFMLFSAFSFLNFNVYSVFFGYHSYPLSPAHLPGGWGNKYT